MIEHSNRIPLLSFCAVLLLGILSGTCFTYADAPSSGSVTGKTVDADGKGVEGTVITVYGKDAEHPIATDTSIADGTFTVANVPAGDSLSVKAVHKGHIFDTGATKLQITVTPDHPSDVGNLELKVIKGSMRLHKKSATAAAATQP